MALSDVQFETGLACQLLPFCFAAIHIDDILCEIVDAEDDLHSQTEDFEEYEEDCEDDSRVEMADHDDSHDEGGQLHGHRPNQSDVACSSSENEMHYRELSTVLFISIGNLLHKANMVMV